MRMGNNKVNANPCDIDDIRRQFPEIAKQLEDLAAAVEGGAVDAFTVMASAADTTPGYLYPKVTTHATRTTADPLVGVEIASPAGNETVTFFLDSSAVTGYNGSGTYALCTVNGVATYVDTTTFGGGGGSDDKTVKVSGADTTSEYLHTSMKDPDTYDAARDLLILAAIADPAANEKLRLFMRLEQLFSALTLVGLSYDSGTNTLTAAGTGTGTVKIGVADEDIAARSGTTAGSGAVSVWTISGATLSDTGANEVWYNISDGEDVTAGDFVQAKCINGQMILDFEECHILV